MNKIAISIVAAMAIFTCSANSNAQTKNENTVTCGNELCNKSVCANPENCNPDFCVNFENCNPDSCVKRNNCPAVQKGKCHKNGKFKNKKGKGGKGIAFRDSKSPRLNKSKFRMHDRQLDPFAGIELTAEQQKKLDNLKADRRKEAAKLKEKTAEEKREIRAEFDKKIKGILTEEQYAKYKANQVIDREDAKFLNMEKLDRPVNRNARQKVFNSNASK